MGGALLQDDSKFIHTGNLLHWKAKGMEHGMASYNVNKPQTCMVHSHYGSCLLLLPLIWTAKQHSLVNYQVL